MKLRTLYSRRRPATAAVEFACLSPLLLTLLLGIWEVGRMTHVQQVLNNAAREGGRQAAAGTKSIAEVQQSVITYLNNAGINTTGVVVTLTNLTSSSRNEPTTALQLDRYELTVDLPFNNVRWSLASQITSVETLTARAGWVSMRDLPFTLSTSLPVE
jgi:Flp pilus assembly protein TadG